VANGDRLGVLPDFEYTKASMSVYAHEQLLILRRL